jgi:hypothetical protein
VLYESKILECCVGKDSNGKKCAEYLVHFYGWNSSWDRLVVENNIVKDNEENRLLQRSLAEKAALALRGKKLKLNKIPAIIKEVVISSGNNISTQISSNDSYNEENSDFGDNQNRNQVDEDFTQDQNEEQESDERNSDDLDDYNEEMSCRSTDISASITGDNNTMSETNTYEEQESQTQIYCLTNELKSILDKDYIYSVVNKSLYELPLKPNVAQIIDNFSLNNSFGQISNTNTSSEPNQYQTLIPEFKNSLEIYFNALIENNYLFYNDDEKQQFLRYKEYSDCEPIKIYGLVHLLRLLVTMSDFLLATPAITKKQLKIIVKFIQHFIEYLNRKREQF